MRVALVALEILPEPAANLARMAAWANESADEGADLVLFPEASLTGLVNNDDPEHDLLLGTPIPGPATEVLSRVARGRGLHIGCGLLERDGDQLFDSAVLLDPEGAIALRYRRISSGWHGRLTEATAYGQGYDVPLARTALGTFAFLLCGDLFDDTIAMRAHDLGVDWLLFPLWRRFVDGSRDPKEWSATEEALYAERVARVGATTLMVNALADDALGGGAFGGAWVRAADGTPRATLPIGQAGALLADVTRRG